MASTSKQTMTQWIGLGRRKTATVRVFLREGTGQVKVNGRPAREYFTRPKHFETIELPFATTGTMGRFDVIANAEGGGVSGQADALKLGIARALERFDPHMRKILKDTYCLTRDPREKERKKYGQKRARKQFQFSKR